VAKRRYSKDFRQTAVERLRGCENIVALADVDSARAEQAFKTWDKATKYTDFRKMLEDRKHHHVVELRAPHWQPPGDVGKNYGDSIGRGAPLVIDSYTETDTRSKPLQKPSI